MLHLMMFNNVSLLRGQKLVKDQNCKLVFFSCFLPLGASYFALTSLSYDMYAYDTPRSTEMGVTSRSLEYMLIKARTLWEGSSLFEAKSIPNLRKDKWRYEKLSA